MYSVWFKNVSDPKKDQNPWTYTDMIKGQLTYGASNRRKWLNKKERLEKETVRWHNNCVEVKEKENTIERIDSSYLVLNV